MIGIGSLGLIDSASRMPGESTSEACVMRFLAVYVPVLVAEYLLLYLSWLLMAGAKGYAGAVFLSQ